MTKVLYLTIGLIIFQYSVADAQEIKAYSDKSVMETFVSDSQQFNELIEYFLNVSDTLFKCKSDSTTFIAMSYPQDSVQNAHNFRLDHVSFIRSNTLKNFQDNGYIMLISNSTKVLIQKDYLTLETFSDSIVFIGNQEHQLFYSSYCACLDQINVFPSLWFYILPDGSISRNRFNAYFPSAEDKKRFLQNRK